MQPATVQAIAALEQYPAQVREALLGADGIGEVIDILGTVHSNRQQVWTHFKGAVVELEPGEAGDRFRYEAGRQADRSYNTPSLLAKIATALGDRPLIDVLQFLVNSDVLRLTWRWTSLKRLAEELDLTLSIAKHEITDGDVDADIGERWKTASASFVPVDE